MTFYTWLNYCNFSVFGLLDFKDSKYYQSQIDELSFHPTFPDCIVTADKMNNSPWSLLFTRGSWVFVLDTGIQRIVGQRMRHHVVDASLSELIRVQAAIASINETVSSMISIGCMCILLDSENICLCVRSVNPSNMYLVSDPTSLW